MTVSWRRGIKRKTVDREQATTIAENQKESECSKREREGEEKDR